MSESYPFFSFEDNEWTSRFGSLMDEIENPEIELSATVVFYEKSRPKQLMHFLEHKFGLKGPFEFLGNITSNSNLTKSSKLKAISETLKSQSKTSEVSGELEIPF